MRVTLLHYAAPPVVGGVESVLAQQAKLLAQAGHTVQVLAGRGQTWTAEIPVHILPFLDSRHPSILQGKAALDQGSIPPEFDSLVALLHTELRRACENVDVIIAHNVASLAKNLPLTAALYNLSQKKGGPRVILWHHDLAWTTPRYQAELHPGFPWDLLRTAWPGVRQVVVSPARQQELAELMGLPLEQIRVVPSGLNLAEFIGLSSSLETLCGELHLDQAEPLFLAPVRITPRKNLELGLRILGALRQHFPAAQLVITGPLGAHNPANINYLNRLRELRAELGLEDAAHFLAEHRPEGLTDGEITECYRLADALLMPSREEGFGIPILEAGLGRLPIFCSDLPPLRHLAGDWATYFSPNGDADQIAAAVVDRLRLDPVYNMRAHVKAAYSWPAIYARHIAPLLEEP